MTCLTATATRVGDFQAEITPVGGMTADVERVGGLEASLDHVPCSAGLTRVGSMTVMTERIGGMEATLTKVGGLGCALTPVAGLGFGLDKEGNLTASAEHIDNGFAAVLMKVDGAVMMLEKVCSTNVTVPYLEIDPTIIWVIGDWASNDVYSNTDWNID